MIIISERTVFLYLCLYECCPFFGMRLFETKRIHVMKRSRRASMKLFSFLQLQVLLVSE